MMMKGLIRNEEVYLETEWSAYTRANLEWYYTKSPDGNGYALVEAWIDGSEPKDYTVTETEVEDEDGDKRILLTAVFSGEGAKESCGDDEYVTLNGKRILKSDLVKLLG